MALYQSAKQNRRQKVSVAGNSLLSSGHQSFTHQIFRPRMPATQLESINLDHQTLVQTRGRENGCDCTLETIQTNTMATDESQTEFTDNNFAPELTNNSNQHGDIQFLLCKFFVALIDCEETLMKAKADFLDLRFDLENRFMKKFSPVMLFQRIDRAGKGHITRQDVLRFLEENGFDAGHGFEKADLKLIFKQGNKTKFQKFVKLIIDTKLEHRGSTYFNERQAENDQVLRKIDTLPPKLEHAFCELLLQQIHLKKELNFYREQIKGKRGFLLLDLFKGIVFENERDPSKQIFISDIMRFFRFNKLLIEQQRVESIFYKRVIGPDRPFDYSRLHKLLTKENSVSIVHNPAVQVNGLKEDCRRTIAHKKTLNIKSLSSLTGPQKLNAVQQCLRNRRCCPAPDCPHSKNKVTITGPQQSCKLQEQTAHTKCFHTDHITDGELVSHLQTYLKDLLVLEEELEDTRIRLVSERDFYPKVCFKAFLATDESREQMRLDEDCTGKLSDGLSDLESTVETVFAFLQQNAASQIGMCSKEDLKSFLTEFMKQRMAAFPCEVHNTTNMKYHDFVSLIAPKNRDFAGLMQQRQTDFDLQLHENAYIKTILTQQDADATSCRLARPIFVEQEMHSNVAQLLAESILKIVLTHQRNIEIVRTYERATKGRHETSHVLQYVPQMDTQSTIIRTADVLRFVRGPQPSTKVRQGSEPKHARGSSMHTCVKTAADTCDMAMSTMYTPNPISRRQEFDLIRSNEKEALFLSDRFGGRVDQMKRSELINSMGPGASLLTSVNVGLDHLGQDPGFAPNMLHLSKGKIDESVRII